MKKIIRLFCLLLLIFCRKKDALGQLSGVYNIPSNISSIAAAVSSLNVVGVSSAVTIQVNAGYTETAPAEGYSLFASPGASSLNTITFQKNGIGANPLISAYTGSYVSGTNVQDGIFRFIGADFVTIDGINLTDPNSGVPFTMEFGYGFARASATDGCQYNTIKNCVITLNNQNLGNNNYNNLQSGSRGIDAMNALSNSYTVNLVPTSTAGCTSYNKFYNNLIQNCFMGIALTGYNSNIPFIYSDSGNDIGGTSAITSNTIINFTGFPIKTWGQHDINFSYNVVSNIAGGGSPSPLVRGILINDAQNANTAVNNNTITVASSATLGGTWALVDCFAGGVLIPTNTVTINNNLFINCQFPTITGGNTQYGARHNTNARDVSISKNVFQNLVSTTMGGDITFIHNQSYSTGRIKLDSNDMRVTVASTVANSGDINGVYNNGGTPTSTISISKNRFSNFVINNITSTGAVTWIKNNTTSGILDISENTWNNLALNHSGQHIFVYNQSGSSPMISITNNSILTGYAHLGLSGYFNCIFTSAAGTTLTSIHRITGNNFSNITSTISGIADFSGIEVNGYINSPKPLKEISGNVITNINYNTTGDAELLKLDYYDAGNTASVSSIHNNTISSITTAGKITGLYLGGNTNTLIPINIYQNQLVNMMTSHPTASICGAFLYGFTAVNFYRNKVAGITSTGNNATAYGVYIRNALNTSLQNNLIGSITTPSASGANIVNGVYVFDGSLIKLQNNTIYLNATSSGSLFGSSAVYTSTNPTFEMRNNIVVNTSTAVGVTGKTCAYRRALPTFTSYAMVSNNNLLFAGVPSNTRVIYYDGVTTYSNMAAYKNLVWTREYLSVTELPPFNSTVPASANYLNLNPGVPTQAESSADPATGISNDYTGTIRSITNPDMGAWEGNFSGTDSLAPVFLSSGFTSPSCNLNSRTYTVNMIDLSGVASGSLSPRVYYKVNVGTYTSTQGNLTSGTAFNGVWTFNLTYTVVAFDAISYFLLAQDLAATPNLTAAPSASFVGSNVNTVITPPPFPNSYIIGVTPTITVNSGSICTGNTFTLIPGGANTYTFSGGLPLVSPTINTTYSVTGTNTAGCVSAGPAISNITVIALPTISVNSGSTCSGNSFTMIPGGANTYTFSGGSPIVSPTVTTTYSVTGTSSVGCVSAGPAISTVTVNAIALPTISVNNGSICVGQSFTMVPNGASTYTFIGGGPIVNPTITTSYSVTGTSTAGCVSSSVAIANITVNPNPTISVNSGSICLGNSFTMVPSGAATYTFSGGSAIVSPTVLSSYSVIGTNSLGCVSTSSAISNVSVNPNPTISAGSGTVCTGNSFTIVPSGALNYTYSGGSPVVNPTATTSYSITGTNSLGCVSPSPAVITITAAPLPTITVNSGTICAGQIFTINPGGALSYTYSGGSATVSPPVNTSYTVSGNNNLGCLGTAVSNVTVNALPNVNLVTSNSLLCVGQSATLTATGGITYTWSTASNSNIIVVSPTINTVYSFTATDAAGCKNSTSFNQMVDLCNGIENLSAQNNQLLVYPNPFTGKMTIISGDYGKSLVVFNSIGSVIYSATVDNLKTEIDLSRFSNGVYLLKIGSYSQKIIKIE